MLAALDCENDGEFGPDGGNTRPEDAKAFLAVSGSFTIVQAYRGDPWLTLDQDSKLESTRLVEMDLPAVILMAIG